MVTAYQNNPRLITSIEARRRVGNKLVKLFNDDQGIKDPKKNPLGIKVYFREDVATPFILNETFEQMEGQYKVGLDMVAESDLLNMLREAWLPVSLTYQDKTNAPWHTLIHFSWEGDFYIEYPHELFDAINLMTEKIKTRQDTSQEKKEEEVTEAEDFSDDAMVNFLLARDSELMRARFMSKASWIALIAAMIFTFMSDKCGYY